MICFAAGSVLLLGCQNSTNTQNASSNAASSSSQVVSSGIYDPCDLITQDDVKAVFPDGTITVIHHDTDASITGQKICFYSAATDNAKFVQVSVTSTPAISPQVMANGESAQKLYLDGKALFKDAQAVPGLGDDAYFGGTGVALGGGLHVLDKARQTEFTIDVGLGSGNSDAQQHIDTEKSLAQKVLNRL